MMLTKYRQVETGFTLIEVLIAIAVMTIGILSLYAMQINSATRNVKSSRITTAAALNTGEIEKRISLPYNDVSLRDTDADGTNQDTSAPPDGIDDSGGNFGLDDILCCPNGQDPSGQVVAGCVGQLRADGCQMVENYFIYWNVAEDALLLNTKTIRVLVQDTQRVLSAPVTFTYIRTDII